MIKKYRKLPVTIEAIKFDRNNLDDVSEFLGDAYGGCLIENRLGGRCELKIKTPEDGSSPDFQVEHIATEGDYIIKGIAGEFYPCKPDIFEKSYAEIDFEIYPSLMQHLKELFPQKTEGK